MNAHEYIDELAPPDPAVPVPFEWTPEERFDFRDTIPASAIQTAGWRNRLADWIEIVSGRLVQIAWDWAEVVRGRPS